MALLSLGILSMGVLKESAKFILRPKQSRLVSKSPPYDRLCISAILSRLAYKSRSEFRVASKNVTHKFPSLEMSFEQVIFEKDTDLVMLDASKNVDDSSTSYHDTQAFIWFRNGHAYVIFRGTDSKNDVLSDIDVRRSKFGKNYGALVHNGFLQQFNAIENDLTAYLKRHRSEYTDITFIGHSLGSACALLAALFYAEYFKCDCLSKETIIKNKNEDDDSHYSDVEDYGITIGDNTAKVDKQTYRDGDGDGDGDGTIKDIKDEEIKPPVIHCHGFGGPRVGNECFAQYFGDHKILTQNTWQVRQYEDVVTMIPLSFRFCHVPSPTLYFHKGNVEFNESGKDNPWFMRPFALLTKINLFNVTESHNLDKYIESVLEQYKNME